MMLVFRAKSAKKKPADHAAFKVDLLEYICAFIYAWSMKLRVQDQEEDQRGPGERLSERTVKLVN